jgi:hypothetical protein
MRASQWGSWALPDGAGEPGAAEPAGNHARWLAVLDELEAQLAAAAARTDGGAGLAEAWAAPKDLGLIPDELVGRATELAAAQQQAIASLRVELRANRRQSAYLQAVPKAAGTGTAVYLDVDG